MEPTELMIGDWVFNKHHKKYIQITPYDFFNHAHLPSGEKYFVSELKVISGRDFEPILLTKEILEKNGFLLVKDEPETDFEPSYKEWRFTDGLITISFEPEVLTFEVHNGGEGSKPVRTMNYFTDYDAVFVHEFQHALRLCGLSDLADNFKVED